MPNQVSNSVQLILKPYLLTISRCSKLFYTISRYYFHIESTFSGASVSFVLSHIVRYAPSPEENSCTPTAHFQCIVKQKWFEKISSPFIIRICVGVLRTLGFYINFHQSAINGHQCCVLAYASPLSVLKHALRRKCSLMATPSKRDSVNAQSSFKIRSVDSQTTSV